MQEVGGCGRLSDCEELVGFLQKVMGSSTIISSVVLDIDF